MSASLANLCTIRCDHPGCDRSECDSFELEGDFPRAVYNLRKQLCRDGWRFTTATRTEPLRDFCPSHAKGATER